MNKLKIVRNLAFVLLCVLVLNHPRVAAASSSSNSPDIYPCTPGSGLSCTCINNDIGNETWGWCDYSPCILDCGQFSTECAVECWEYFEGPRDMECDSNACTFFCGCLIYPVS